MRQTITLSGEPKSTADLPICLPRTSNLHDGGREGAKDRLPVGGKEEAQWRAAPRGDELARSVQIVAAMHSRKQLKLEGRSD